MVWEPDLNVVGLMGTGSGRFGKGGTVFSSNINFDVGPDQVVSVPHVMIELPHCNGQAACHLSGPGYS